MTSRRYFPGYNSDYYSTTYSSSYRAPVVRSYGKNSIPVGDSAVDSKFHVFSYSNPWTSPKLSSKDNYQTRYNTLYSWNPTTKFPGKSLPSSGTNSLPSYYKKSAYFDSDKMGFGDKFSSPDRPSNSGSFSYNSMPTSYATSYSANITSPNVSYRDIFNQIAQIHPYLYLSSLNAIDAMRLRELGITLIVSAINDKPPAYFSNNIDVMHIRVDDVEQANIKVHFDRVADRIHLEQQRGGRALVHCVAGISRSTSLILAYLMKHCHMDLRTAFQAVKRKRCCVMPNVGFWRQLVQYEERLRGARTNKLTSSDVGNVILKT